MNCPRCQKEIPSDASSCSACGFSPDDETQKLESPNTPSNKSRDKRSFTSFDSIDDARFVPGAMLAERYRIVGLVGKGGMGEVYRADDLKLGQPVALKFLPDHLLSDGAALARFHREVRVARQVSHKNVCRVYDIGEVEGRHFLSMEFINGEELSSLLRRIGRLPQDKAIQLARQICAGLAAAHDAGVLHRDLKPSNVMVDEHGNARITDFGLAGLAEEFRDDEIHAGTPAYMAPEQLDGKTFTVRSDIYSLGLVLYEVFTGRKAFEAASLNELIKLRRSDTSPTTPTSIVKDLDPAIEKVIDRCLQKDQARRPASALQVAAALPGSDPIAAALAAGETPSPEMVAAAPKEGALKPAVALSMFASLMVGLALVVLLADKVVMYGYVLALLFRRDWLAFIVGWFLFSSALALLGGGAIFNWVGASVTAGLTTLVLFRYGLLAMLAAIYYLQMYIQFPVTTQVTAWYAMGFLLALIILLAMSVYAFRISVAGQPLTRGRLLEE